MYTLAPYLIASVIFLIYHGQIIKASDYDFKLRQASLIFIIVLFGIISLWKKILYLYKHSKEFNWHIAGSIAIGFIVSILYNGVGNYNQGSLTITIKTTSSIAIVLYFVMSYILVLLLMLPNDES